MITKSGETAPPLSTFPKHVQEIVIAVVLKGLKNKVAHEKRLKQLEE